MAVRKGKPPKYCREWVNPKEDFDPKSFRIKKISEDTKILIGCPKGYWDNVTQRCQIGTRLVSILHDPKKKICPPGEYVIVYRGYTGGKIIPATEKLFKKYREKYLKEQEKLGILSYCDSSGCDTLVTGLEDLFYILGVQ